MITQLESMINSYLREVGIYLKENSLLITAPKSTVTLFTPDTHQFQTHPNITLEDTQLPLERSQRIQRLIMDPSLSFHKHCNYVTNRIIIIIIVYHIRRRRLLCAQNFVQTSLFFAKFISSNGDLPTIFLR